VPTSTIEIRDETTAALSEHARISIAFEVRSIFHVEAQDRGLSGFTLVERPVGEPWIKDYDADHEHGPMSWATRFDTSTWGLVSAWDGSTRAGGAVLAFDTPGLNMRAGRGDLAVVWDIRVAPQSRRSGIGSMLFRAAEDRARARGCARLEVETQNINVAACRLYARMGCELRRIDRFAYADLPHEVELLWSKQLI
jgi:ribosomal protein S18 acetylase RimI-like enzyme